MFKIKMFSCLTFSTFFKSRQKSKLCKTTGEKSES